MSESAGRACAWQYLYLHRKGASWVTCEESAYNLAVADPHNYETRVLVPEQLLIEAETALTASLRTYVELHKESKANESKLAAVLALADRMISDGYHGNDHARGPLYNFENELIALTQTPTEAVKK